MKTCLYVLLFATGCCFGQSFSDEKIYEVGTSGLESVRLHNLYGPVEVVGISGNSLKLTVKRQLTSASGSRLEKAKSEIYYDSLLHEGHLYFFMESPTRQFRIDEDGNGKYRWDRDYDDKDRFEVEAGFTIKLEIPNNLDLYVTNHHDVLRIENIEGDLYARNHHEDLFAGNLGGNATLKNHHGDIEASFTQNPSEDCSFRTHHGDIRITYQKNLSADVTLSSRHGEFFTSFDWSPTRLPVKKKSTDKGTKYVADAGVAVRIGSGGPLHQYRTWHGDIFLESN